MQKYFVRIMRFLDNFKSDDHPSRDVTLLLRRWARGDAEASTQLVKALYPELKRIAEQRSGGRGSITLFRPRGW